MTPCQTETTLQDLMSTGDVSWRALLGKLPFSCASFSLRVNGKLRRVQHGVLVLDAMAEPARFLAEQVLPEGDSPAALLVRNATRICHSRAARLRYLSQYVPETPNRSYPPFNSLGELPAPLLAWDSLGPHRLMPHEDGVHAIRTSAFVVLQLAREEELEGRRIPRTLLVCFPSGAAPMARSGAWWDGVRLRPLRSLDELPSDVLAAIEEEGMAMPDEQGLFQGPADLECRFLLRVPEELAHEDLVIGAPSRPPHAVLERPAFLFDSRATIPLRDAEGKAPVVLDDSEAVRFVMAHLLMPGRVYAPEVLSQGGVSGGIAKVFGAASVGRSERWILGASPRVMR